MRRFKGGVPVLCTLLLLGLGAGMPHLAALALDRRLEAEVALRENADINLVLAREADFFQTLELFQTSQAQVELSEGYRMTAEEAASAALEAMLKLPASGMVYTAPAVTPVLMTGGNTPGLSGVFWRCVWGEADGAQEVLWLDDQSGRVVAFQGWGRTSTMAVTGEDAVIRGEALQLAEYCRTSYPVDQVKVALEAEGEGWSSYAVTLIRDADGRGETCGLSLRLRGDRLYFNL